MSWDDLPIELCVKILSNRFIMREDAQKKIVRCWKNFDSLRKFAIALWMNTLVAPYCFVWGGPFQLTHPHTANVMEYLIKIISRKHYNDFWRELLEKFEDELLYHEIAGSDECDYYKRNKAAFIVLTQKLQYSSRILNFNK